MTKKTEKVATETPSKPKTLLKTCSHCGRILPASEFYKSGKGRLREECKTCNKEETHKRYLEKNGLADANFTISTPLGRYSWENVVAKKDAEIIKQFVSMVKQTQNELWDMRELADTQHKLIRRYRTWTKVLLWFFWIILFVRIMEIIYILSS